MKRKELRLGQRLKKLRKDWGFTQKQVAEYLGVTQSQVARIEKGIRPLREEHIDKICLLYRIDEFQLLNGISLNVPKPRICRKNW